jgi:hypothetical protein
MTTSATEIRTIRYSYLFGPYAEPIETVFAPHQLRHAHALELGPARACR